MCPAYVFRSCCRFHRGWQVLPRRGQDVSFSRMLIRDCFCADLAAAGPRAVFHAGRICDAETFGFVEGQVFMNSSTVGLHLAPACHPWVERAANNGIRSAPPLGELEALEINRLNRNQQVCVSRYHRRLLP